MKCCGAILGDGALHGFVFGAGDPGFDVSAGQAKGLFRHRAGNFRGRKAQRFGGEKNLQ